MLVHQMIDRYFEHRHVLDPDAQALYDEAKKKHWTVISMKNDWKKIFAFE